MVEEKIIANYTISRMFLLIPMLFAFTNWSKNLPVKNYSLKTGDAIAVNPQQQPDVLPYGYKFGMTQDQTIDQSVKLLENNTTQQDKKDGWINYIINLGSIKVKGHFGSRYVDKKLAQIYFSLFPTDNVITPEILYSEAVATYKKKFKDFEFKEEADPTYPGAKMYRWKKINFEVFLHRTKECSVIFYTDLLAVQNQKK